MSRFGSRSRTNTRVSGWLRPPGSVKSVQRGSIAMTNGVASNTATITSVDVNNAQLRYLGQTAGSGEISSAMARLVFTNATTITASRSASLNTTTVSFEVVEYWPGVMRSVQRGTFDASSTATISAVQSTSKTTVDSLGADNNDGTASTDMQSTLWRLTLTNTTTITGTRSGAAGTITAGYQAIEWF